MLEAIDLMFWGLVYTVVGGTCLVVGSVFVSMALMIMKSGWEASDGGDGGKKRGEES